MKSFNPDFNERKSIRLKGYDYADDGLYFITICCYDRIHLFGEISNGTMILNDAGIVAEQCWLEIPKHFTNVILHEYVIMPNHIHGIIEIVGANQHSPGNTNKKPTNMENIDLNVSNDSDNPPNIRTDVDSQNITTNDDLHSNRANVDSPLRSPSKTIGSIVRGYKIGVTKWMRQNTDVHNVWQRNYYEHIVRNEQSYSNIAEYIRNNPTKWQKDKFYSK